MPRWFMHLGLAAVLVPSGCNSLLSPGPEDGADAFPEPELEVAGFGRTLSGTVTLADDLDPALLRVGAFEVMQAVPTELIDGGLGQDDIRLWVSLEYGTLVAEPDGIASGDIVRHLVSPDHQASIATDGSHAWDLELPDSTMTEYVVVAWYDEDEDGWLALSPGGEGSEYATALSQPAPYIDPDFRLVLELVWWHALGEWRGNAAGMVGDGTFHEEAVSEARASGWEAAIPAALR